MATSNPAVCVVVPVLNEARYVREAMDSLLAQDYEPLEVVVYDGGSTDGTIEILNSYPLKTEIVPGLGQMAAINRGWRQTAADFVAWMAGDDRYLPGALRRLADELQTHADAGFAHGDANIIDEDGRVIDHAVPGDVRLRDIVFNLSVIPQSTLIRRSALDRAGYPVESRRFAADYDLFLRLSQYYPSHYVPFTAAEYRSHATSEDNQNYERVGDAVVDVISQFFRRPDLSPSQKSLETHGIAGSHLFAGNIYCLAGRRRKAWKSFLTVLRAEPSAMSSSLGRHLLVRLLTPVNPGPYQFQRSKTKWLGRAPVVRPRATSSKA